jgi:hypothetical protein
MSAETSHNFSKTKNLHGYHVCPSVYLWLEISDLIILSNVDEFCRGVLAEVCQGSMCFVKIGWVAVTLYSLLVPSSMVQQLTA